METHHHPQLCGSKGTPEAIGPFRPYRWDHPYSFPAQSEITLLWLRSKLRNFKCCREDKNVMTASLYGRGQLLLCAQEAAPSYFSCNHANIRKEIVVLDRKTGTQTLWQEGAWSVVQLECREVVEGELQRLQACHISLVGQSEESGFSLGFARSILRFLRRGCHMS